jgi:hypothetical protein
MDSNTSPAASFDSVETMVVIGRRGSSLESPLSILLMISSPPVAAGVSTAAIAAGTGQPTELAAGADAPAPSAPAITAAAVTSADPVESPMSSVNTTVVAEPSSLGVAVADKGVEPSGTALQAGADKSLVTSVGATDVPPTSEVTSAQSSAETGTGAGAVVDPSCVDDRPADVDKLLNLTTPHDYQWTMTGKKCEARTNTSSAPRFVAYWNQSVLYHDTWMVKTDSQMVRWRDPA